MGAFQFFVFMAFTTIWTALFLSIIASKKAGEYDYNPATIVFMVDLLKMAVTIVSCLFSQYVLMPRNKLNIPLESASKLSSITKMLESTMLFQL